MFVAKKKAPRQQVAQMKNGSDTEIVADTVTKASGSKTAISDCRLTVKFPTEYRFLWQSADF